MNILHYYFLLCSAHHIRSSPFNPLQSSQLETFSEATISSKGIIHLQPGSPNRHFHISGDDKPHFNGNGVTFGESSFPIKKSPATENPLPLKDSLPTDQAPAIDQPPQNEVTPTAQPETSLHTKPRGARCKVFDVNLPSTTQPLS